tara:strand:- start:144 stop:440 length:297 start_codon:yes stop_codon:yes gene_type:complete
MTLDFECDSKDMDERTAELIETVQEIYELVISYSPRITDAADSREVDMKCAVGFAKTLSVIQLITGICRHEAEELLDHVVERSADTRIEKLNQQFENS